MNAPRLAALAACSAALLVAVAASAAPVQNPELKAYMKAVVDPAANAVFAGGNDPPENETPAAKEARFAAAAKGAATLKDAAIRLQKSDFAPKGEADWTKISAKMTEVATAAETAAKAKNQDGAFAAGGDLYEVCNGCHKEYQAGRS